MLRKRVLDCAVNEINEKTDIQLEYVLERRGRKIVAITLLVKSKEQAHSLDKTFEIEKKLNSF